MANGGMWPMYPSSDRGGLLVQGIEEVPAGAAALGAAAIEHGMAGAAHVYTPEPPAARSALATAADVVEHRRATYGSPKENFQRIADFWSISLRDKLKPGETVSLADVAQMMRLVKEARLIETPGHFDSLVDICGYVDCQQQVLS